MAKFKKQPLLSWLMVLVMILGLFTPIGTAYGAEDVYGKLTDVNVKVTQGGREISEGGTLTTDEISVEVSFGVPVAGDEPKSDDPVQKGNIAIFKLGEGFKLVAGKTVTLKDGDTPVGTVTFDDSTGEVIATVDFDGEDEVFNGETGINDVNCKFNAELEYNGKEASDKDQDVTVTILNKTFHLTIPAIEKKYAVTKSGEANLAEKTIEWTVDITGKQGEKSLDLGGYKFSDDLSNVGDYVTDSFKIGGNLETPDWDDSSKTLSYTFPDNSTSPQTVTFKTTIPDDEYYGSGEQTIKNTAKLLDGEDELAKGSIPIKFTPQWIEKGVEGKTEGSGGVYNPKDRTITWTITANQMGAVLNNVVITDLLPEGLTLKSATLQTWDGSKWVDTVKKWDGAPADGEYKIGNISSKILLTVVTYVKDDPYTTGKITYTNSAKIRWDGLPGDGISGSVNVDIGYNAITKSGVAEPSTGKIKWTVKVDAMSQTIPDMKVYDFLVYGNKDSGFNVDNAEGIPEGVTKADLTPQYNQKYVYGSFSGEGLRVTVHPIMEDGNRVADLLEIVDFPSTATTFTFESQILNPDIYAGNKTQNVYNTATLFSGNAKLNEAKATVGYPSNMLAKEMLKRGTDPLTGVNNKTTDANEGFDYKDKSVIFRLSVNADGMDLTNMPIDADGTKMGTATLTDTLPKGWKFAKFDTGKDYLIFANGSTTPTTLDTSILEAKFIEGTEDTVATATFTFEKLDKSYVILIKARPTNDTLAGYFDSNEKTTVTNNLSLKTENWEPGISTKQDVTINSEILNKTLSIPRAGELLWTVDYKPYDLDHQGARIEDTLPPGIDLRTDSQGKLLIDGNINIYEMTLKADGSYTQGENPIELVLGKDISYDNAGRILTFNIPDSAKAYRFTYVTDITGEPGTISNQVKLYGSSGEQQGTDKPYVITAADGSATLQRSGWIEITKTGAKGNLAGAEFTVFAKDGTTVIRKGVTGSNGKV